MNTDFAKRSRQRTRLVLVSGAAIAVCLFVAALLERRKVAASAEATRRARSFVDPESSTRMPAEGVNDAASTWAPAGPAGDPVWEDNGLSTPGSWPTSDAAESVEESEVFERSPEVEPVAEVVTVEDDWHQTVEPEVEHRPSVASSADIDARVEVEAVALDDTTVVPQAEVEPWISAPEQHARWDAPLPELGLKQEPGVEHEPEWAAVGEQVVGFEHAPEVEPSWTSAAEPDPEPAAEPGPWQPAPAFGAWQPAPVSEPVAEAPVFEPVVEQPAHEEQAPAVDHWFGSYAPTDTWQPPVTDQREVEPSSAHEQPDAFAGPAPSYESDAEPVIELPAEATIETPAAPEDPKRLPPPRLRRFMGTGASVLVLGLVLGAGFLVSGATADSTSDPATVPDAVATATFAPDVVADTTSTDTTTTGTTTTDTTSTATATTGTTTTDTTTTATTATTTTPTDTTPTTTTPTTTTPTDPTTTTTTPPPPADTTPVASPASDPATVPAAVPAAPVAAPPAAPVVTPPVTPTTPAKPVAPKKHGTTQHATSRAPAKAGSSSSPEVGLPPSSGAPVVTLASGADPIGSILSANAVIPAIDASLLPTPAQVSFYVKASKPLAALPTLVRIGHPVAQRLVAAGRHARVGWTVLAAVARLESGLGKRPGLLAGRALPSTPSGDGLTALGAFLHAHGAAGNPLAPATAKKALTMYFDGSTRKADRVIALAALYGALGPAGMQHGVRAETARLQKRVLRDKRVHLTIAGRSDIRHGRVDPRVLVTLEYLANSFHKVGISDLVSGGALFSRSGSVSAHLYGRAADVASLHGMKVRGHQGPGTMTEQAIRKLLLLPKSLRPRQVISLMDVDGPTGNHGSFALPDHYDRIQIDY